MIFAIPVSAADFDKLPKFMRVLQFFGGLKAHKAILMPTVEVAPGIRPYVKQAQELFSSVDLAPVSTPKPGAWPYPCNQHFAHAVEILKNLVDGPWMWLELDSCPIKPEWADDLQFQYQTKGRPFLGVLRNTEEVWPDADGQHMVGVGIYPQNFPAYTQLWQFPVQDIPFDVMMRYDVAPHVYPTNLIAHFWHSRNFQPDMSGMDSYGNQVIIPREAILVHGVKDDSLYDIILGEASAPVVIQEPAKKQPIAAPVVIKQEGYTLEEMASTLRGYGYFVVSPDAQEGIFTTGSSLPTEEYTISAQPNDMQGDPAMGTPSSRPVETKVAAEPNATKVQLPKRGRPRKVQA